MLRKKKYQHKDDGKGNMISLQCTINLHIAYAHIPVLSIVHLSLV